MEEKDTSDPTKMTAPSVEIGLDELLKDLIGQLAARVPDEDVTDADIDREVQAVRNTARPV